MDDSGARWTLRDYRHLFREKPMRFWLVDTVRLLRDTRRAEKRATALAALTPDQRAAFVFGVDWRERMKAEGERQSAIGAALGLGSITVREFAERQARAVQCLQQCWPTLRLGDLDPDAYRRAMETLARHLGTSARS